MATTVRKVNNPKLVDFSSPPKCPRTIPLDHESWDNFVRRSRSLYSMWTEEAWVQHHAASVKEEFPQKDVWNEVIFETRD